MLKTILSVSGKPGLFKLISNGKNMVIVESLADKRKLPIYARDKVVSLGDIAIYTETDEVPLSEILSKIEIKEDGKQASIATSAKPEELRKFLAEILPDYDKERVHDSDIKKLISWYNLLINAGYSFKTVAQSDSEEVTAVEEVVENKDEEPKVEKKKTKTTKATKTTKSETEEPKKKAPKAKKEKE